MGERERDKALPFVLDSEEPVCLTSVKCLSRLLCLSFFFFFSFLSFFFEDSNRGSGDNGCFPSLTIKATSLSLSFGIIDNIL